MQTELLERIPSPHEIRCRLGTIGRERLLLQQLLKLSERKQLLEKPIPPLPSAVDGKGVKQ